VKFFIKETVQYKISCKIRLLFYNEISFLSYMILYRVIQEESAVLWEMIVCVILSKKVHMNMHRNTKGESPCVANVKNCVRIKDRLHELRRAPRSTLQRVHKCIEGGGGIFENLL